MNRWRWSVSCWRMCALIFALSAGAVPSPGHAETCRLSSEHVGLRFPVDKVSPEWTCRLESIISTYTTATKVGPLRTALSEPMHRYLLDRPPLAAAMINRLSLGPQRAELRGENLYWVNDGEGTEGTVQLVLQDGRTRIYYLEGTHRTRLLPNVRGKAVVFLLMDSVKDANGNESMDNTVVAYTKLDNPILSGLASLLRPLIGGVATRKLAKGAEVLNRLGLEMRDNPERVLTEASKPPALSADDLAFLKSALGRREKPDPAGPTNPANP
ncbi:hypothetical protein [Petrachloros mirabilis]